MKPNFDDKMLNMVERIRFVGPVVVCMKKVNKTGGYSD